MKIYTKTGDAGTTFLCPGQRVLKSNILIKCIGSADNLNAWIGSLTSIIREPEINEFLTEIQKNIHVFSTILSSVHKAVDESYLNSFVDSEVKKLENNIDTIDATLRPLTNFILLQGGPITTQCHLARTACRNFERKLNELFFSSEQYATLRGIYPYINRLSDYLFMLARKHTEGDEKIWKDENINLFFSPVEIN